MKIYFSASSSHDTNRDINQKIIQHLKSHKHEVLENINTDQPVKPNRLTAKDLNEWYAWYSVWTKYVKSSDVAVVEASYPSTVNTGFEIGMLLARGKPVVLLYQLGRDPVLISDTYTPKIIKSEYTEENCCEVLDWCLEEVLRLTNRRFTLFISPEIDNFLTQISRKKNTSKSKYIRGLIEREMANSKQILPCGADQNCW